jgi:hypothetical protein
MTSGSPVKYEIEHIWANHPRRYSKEFEHTADFADHRNLVGDLLLLPKKFNASYGDMTYEKKLPHYNVQNLLARSLDKQCYQNNPGFRQFVDRTGLPFRSYDAFTAEAILDRGKLYAQIAQHIWNPDDLLVDETPCPS